jgi:hypothetical protein
MQEIFEGVTPPPKPPQKVIASLIERLFPHESWEAFGPFGGNFSAEPVALTLTLPAAAAAAFHRGPPTDLLTDR